MPSTPIGELPKDVQTQLVISLVVFAIFIGVVAYWKRHEIFKLEKKKKPYSYKPQRRKF